MPSLARLSQRIQIQAKQSPSQSLLGISIALAIGRFDGILKVRNSSALNSETTPQFDLTVTVTDNGSPVKTGSGLVTVFLRDVNKFAPVVTPKQFSIDENLANGTVVGTVPASNDDTSQTKTYAITAGNFKDTFAIDASTGKL